MDPSGGGSGHAKRYVCVQAHVKEIEIVRALTPSSRAA
jgi:hypothetical protein